MKQNTGYSDCSKERCQKEKQNAEKNKLLRVTYTKHSILAWGIVHSHWIYSWLCNTRSFHCLFPLLSSLNAKSFSLNRFGFPFRSWIDWICHLKICTMWCLLVDYSMTLCRLDSSAVQLWLCSTSDSKLRTLKVLKEF